MSAELTRRERQILDLLYKLGEASASDICNGLPVELADAMDDSGLPYLPGVATVSEMLAVAERGRTEMKFFPAEAAGGVPLLKAVAGPMPELAFCPTGGITPDSAPDYLALGNVGCVGGSWLTPSEAVAAGDWGRVRELATRAAGLRPPTRR